MVGGDFDVVIQPLGETPAVLESPFATYKPQIVVLISGMQNHIDIAKEHIEGPWAIHARNPIIIEKIIDEPWTGSTLVRYMKQFDDAVSEVEKLVPKGKKVNWHVGITGGTSLMKIASAFSAFSYGFSVYGSLDSKYNPRSSVFERLFNIDLFINLGKINKELSKTRSLKVIKIIAEKSPQSLSDILEHYGGRTDSTANISAATSRMKELKLISKDKDHGWKVTPLGKLHLARLGEDLS